MSKVIFVDKNSVEKVPLALKYLGLEKFSNKKVLIKLHMGEIENKWYVKPKYVKIVVDELKKIKSKPFLFDTVVIYRGSRDSKEKYMETAKKHGFDQVGCGIVIGNEGKFVEMNLEGIKFSYEVADELYRTEDIISITHGKGHLLTGFGGVIKNLGMGGVSKQTKSAMHTAAVTKSFLSLGRSEITFSKILALGAKACLMGKNAIHMNVLLDITKHCDCANDALPIICKDIGFLFSRDPVAIDAASIDMIENAEKSRKVFDKDPWEQVEFGEKIGLGNRKYKLVEI
jgi:uncharacterized Fe-S center protein